MSETPLEPLHPGEILREEFMVPFDLTEDSLALALRVPVAWIAEVLDGRRPVSADMALRLARYFDTTAELWLGLQTEYDLRKTMREVGATIERKVRPRAA